VAFEASTYCTCFTGGMQPHAHVPTRRRNANEPGRHAVEDLELLYEASSPRSQVYVRTFCFKAGQLASRRRNMSQQLTSADGGTVAPSNAAILGDDDHGFARTADDYILEELSSEPEYLKKWMGWKENHLLQLPTAYYMSDALYSVRYHRQIYAQLPVQLESSHHVYVVCSPHEGWPISTRHWSIYTRGFFFHLSADGVHKATGDSRRNSRHDVKAPVRLCEEDSSSSLTPEYQHALTHAFEKPYIAFEVGKTQYSYRQFHRLAAGLIERLKTYDLREANCQIFTLALLRRTVMCQRDCSTFIGNKTQIVDWDLGIRNDLAQPVPRSKERGFLLREPKSPTKRTIMSRSPFFYATLIRTMQVRSIAKLYKHGFFRWPVSTVLRMLWPVRLNTIPSHARYPRPI
jgi:hypothetical protein